MLRPDVVGFAYGSLRRHPLRSGLTLLAMAVGVAAVVTLTALGEGARRFVAAEFSALGSHVLIVLPGRNETTGGPPPLLGETPRDLTLSDARALQRNPAIARVAPLMVGVAPARYDRLEREVTVLGTSADFLAIRVMRPARGRGLPAGDLDSADPVAVIGAGIERELFARQSPIGRWLRLGERRFRVVGVLAETGQSLGFDLDDVVMVPVAAALNLFNSESLVRILVEAAGAGRVESARESILATVRERHEGEDDITVITQDAMIRAFDRVFNALTLAVGGIAAISLVVAAVLIMNVTLVSVAQRQSEIGLLMALGATRRDVRELFLGEASMLAAAGGGCGVCLGLLAVAGLRLAYPDVPFAAPAWALLGSTLTAILAGLLFSILPANRAARLDPVAALSRR